MAALTNGEIALEIKQVPAVAQQSKQFEEAKDNVQKLINDTINNPMLSQELKDPMKIFLMVTKAVESINNALIESGQIKLTSKEKLQLAMYSSSLIAHSEAVKGKIPAEVLQEFKRISDNSREAATMINMIIEIANNSDALKSIGNAMKKSGWCCCC